MKLNFISDYILNPLVKLVYPDFCQVCKRLLSIGEVLLCNSCFEEFDFSPYLSKSFTIRDFQFSFVYSLGVHDGFLREFIHKMKYENYQSIVKKILLKALTDDYLIKEVFFKRTLVPIPLHPSRFRERGFNQSEVIANVLSEITSCEVKRVLKRVKATKPMIELSPKERELNVKDAFCFKGSYLLKKAVIIDDVLTTGSTIYECARVLKKKGCNDISVFTISRAS